MQSGPTLNADILNDSWIDFYSLLDLAPDADETVIRKRISARYTEASTNYNHRDPKRREYYQLLGQQVIPQCRRILLNPEFREWYDCQNALHQAGDANALDYKAFLLSLNEDGSAPAPASPVETAAPASVEVPVATVATAAASAATEMPEPVSMAEVDVASFATESFLSEEVATVEPVATSPVEVAAPAPKRDFIAETAPVYEPAPVIPPSPATPVETAAKKSTLRPVAPTGPTTFIQDNLAAPHQIGKAVKQAIKEEKKRKKTTMQENSYKPRVAVGDSMMAQSTALSPSSGLFRPGERALSDTSIALLTAIVASMLSITIDYFSIPGLAQFAAIGLAFTQGPRIREFLPRSSTGHSTPQDAKNN